MSFFQRCFVRFSGHTFDTRSGCEPEDYAMLSMLGVTVALASLLSGVNAGVAAWVYTEGSLMPIRVGLVGIAFLFVLTVVLTMDRQAIYAADTSLQMNPKLLALQLGCRVVFVLCIGAASSQAVLPLLLKAELRLTALEMREERGRQRTSNVEGQLDLNRKRDEARAGEKRIKELEAAQGSVPPDVARRLAAAEACRASVAAERQRIQLSGPMSSEQG